MKKAWRNTLIGLALSVSLAGGSARAADNLSGSAPGECFTASGYTTCGTNIVMNVDPGSAYIGLYVQQDAGVWALVACYPRGSQSQQFNVAINWIARQHHFLFKLHSQGDCNPAVYLTGDERKHTGSDSGGISTPASDSPEAGWVYRAIPNGYGGYIYHWLTAYNGCGQYFNGVLEQYTCWNTNSSLALTLTRRSAEYMSSFAQLAMTQKNLGANPSFGVTGGNGAYWVWDYFDAWYHYLAPAYNSGAYAGDANAGHWQAVMLGSAIGQSMDLSSAVVMQRVGIDAAATAGLSGVAYSYAEQ